MHLMAMGLSHKTATQDQRQQLAFNPDLIVTMITEFLRSAHAKAAVMVSTCNRTEIYLEANSLANVLRWVQQEHRIKAVDLRANTYLYMDLKAVQHLMRVASGLDSMVLGEVEILGQLKNAYQLAQQHNFVSKSLGRLFETSFAVAKKVRTQTDIGLNPVSVASLAVRLAERIFAKIADQKVLLIGAGDTARLVAKHLASAGVADFVLANRTVLRAHEMAQEIGLKNYKVIELNAIPDYLPQADIVVTATTAPLPIVGKGMVERAVKIRKHKAMFMVDLAITRDIEIQVREIADVYLYGIDDLQNIAEEHQRCRNTAAQQADLIILREADRFMQWLDGQHVHKTIQAFREHCVVQRDKVLHDALRQLDAGKDPRLVLQRFGHLLLNKIIHEPTKRLRADVAISENSAMQELLRKLFRVSDNIITVDENEDKESLSV